MKRKLFITTTAARTLFFFKGQTKLWNEVFDVCAISSEKEKLINFSQTEGIRYNYMSMHREISLVSDVCCLLRFIWLFIKERPYIVHGNTPKASMLSMLAAWLTCRPIRIYMCHGLRYQTSTGNLRRILMFMEKLSCSCATQVICVSEGVRKPFVASDVKGLREVTKGYGILFPHGDAKVLAEVISRLHDDKQYYYQISERCYERAKEFDISKMVEAYNQVYESFYNERK